MQTFHHPRTGGVRVVPDVLGGFLKRRGWLPAAEGLKGAALDQALEDAGLPKTGTADDKRARLAEHTNPATPEEQA